MGGSFKDSVISECVSILKRKDVKDESQGSVSTDNRHGITRNIPVYLSYP